MHYLIMEDFAGTPAVFIFPERVDHADMRGQLPYARVISCGSVEFGPDGFKCSGGNSELDSKAGPDDVDILLKSFAANDQ